MLKSGRALDADIIVTATGLQLRVVGGVQLSVDNRAIDLARAMTYKGMMFSDVPNLVSVFGYTNASWTLKCDLTCAYVCRLLNHMGARGYTMCMPRRDPAVDEAPWLNLTSGYIKRVEHLLPRQGAKAPWKLHQNYALDMLALRFGKVDDGTLVFSTPDRAAVASRAPLEAAA
jgi:cation diffusion facilitator CzcD-associated flavoprotein CzcO